MCIKFRPPYKMIIDFYQLEILSSLFPHQKEFRYFPSITITTAILVAASASMRRNLCTICDLMRRMKSVLASERSGNTTTYSLKENLKQ